jgi:hypothetical protein
MAGRDKPKLGSRASGDTSKGGISGSGTLGAGEWISAFAVTRGLAPFVMAFGTELGKRLGGSVADWASRIGVRRKPGSGAEALLRVDTGGGGVTVFEVADDMSDDAKLALLDLDVTAKGVHGYRLRWNNVEGRWQPIDVAF